MKPFTVLHHKKIFESAMATYHSDSRFFKKNEHRIKKDYLKFDKGETTVQTYDDIGVNKHVKSFSRSGRPFKRDGRGNFKTNSNRRIIKTKQTSTHILKRNEFNPGFSRPWVDDSIWATIRGSNPDSLPARIDEISTRTVELQDSEATRSYCRDSRNIRRGVCALLFEAGLRAAKSLNLYSQVVSEPVKTVSIDDAVDSLVKRTNSGFPYFGKKNEERVISETKGFLKHILENASFRKVIGQNPMIAINSNLKDFSKLGKDHGLRTIFSNPQVIFHRFQISVEDISKKLCQVKSRLVWCVPYRIVALESYFFKRFIDKSISNNKKSNQCLYSSGLSNAEIGRKLIGRLRTIMACSPGHKMWSLDYSKFDRNLLIIMFDFFFAILESQMKLTKQEKFLYDLLRIYIKFSPFIFKGKLRFQRRGISSGLLITNLYDTWYNLTLWNLVQMLEEHFPSESEEIVNNFGNLLEMDFKWKISPQISKYRNDLSVCGDDALIVSRLFTILLHREVCLSLGMSVKAKEPVSEVDGDVFFLGRYWDQDNYPFQTEFYMSLHCVFRTKWYSKEEVPFDISSDLELNRILSICLPLRNGFDYLEKTFHNWTPYRYWRDNKLNFYLMKEYPDFKIEEIDHYRAKFLYMS